MVVTASIYRDPVQALINSGATRCFVSLAALLPLGLKTIKDYTVLELGYGQKMFSKSKAINVPVVIADLTFRSDLIITSLLHNVDLTLGINCLQIVNPRIDSRSCRVLLPSDAGTSMLPYN